MKILTIDDKVSHQEWLQHDCHLSGEDSCTTCERYFEYIDYINKQFRDQLNKPRHLTNRTNWSNIPAGYHNTEIARTYEV